MLFKSFIILQFSYCPIVWMCFSRGLNEKVNNIHETALRIVYQDKKFSFETLLKLDKICVNSYKNHTYLAAAVVQVKNGYSPEITKEIVLFQENETYNIQSCNHLSWRNIWTTQIGIKNVSNLGGKIRHLMSGEIKDSSYFSPFKHKIRKWISKNVLARSVRHI